MCVINFRQHLARINLRHNDITDPDAGKGFWCVDYALSKKKLSRYYEHSKREHCEIFS